MLFRDEALYDPLKHALTVRDGVLEYLGAEIGQQPPEKSFYYLSKPRNHCENSFIDEWATNYGRTRTTD